MDAVMLSMVQFLSPAPITTAPIALVPLAAQSQLRCMPNDAGCALSVLRQTVVFSLAGVLVTVGIVASVVGRSVPHQPHLSFVQREYK